MSNARAKGLAYVREVKAILQGMGHKVEGPGYGVAFFGGSMKPIHRDYFGAFDLISYRDGSLIGHQVSTLTNKSSKCKTLRDAGIDGRVWCRVGKNDYRVWYVTTHTEEELFI